MPLVQGSFKLVGSEDGLRSFRIVVVDDFERFRRFVCSALRQRAEFQVIAEASDGLEAVEKAKDLQPDLILLDIGLPKLDGIEVARRLRELAPVARILFLSQESSPDVVGEALSVGVGYVHKPCAQSDLLPAIDAVLTGKRFISATIDPGGGTDGQAPHRHQILFCSDDTALLDSLTGFIAAALGAGNAAMVWATESHRASLLQRLHAQGIDVDAAIQGRTYIASDVAEIPDPIRMLEAVRGLREAASKAGKEHPQVAVCGERAGRLWAEGKTDQAILLEQYLNELAKQCEVDILCPYPLPREQEDEHAFKRLCAEHTAANSR